MSVHSSQKKRRKDGHRMRFQSLGNHEKFVERIVKTLYYGKMPTLERFSLPVTELAVELYTEATARKTLERLRLDRAAEISRNTCMSPCSFVLALLYLERLKTCNPSYVERVSPSELFLISMMVATKFLNDSGEEDDVLNSEWACSVGLPLKDINSLEKDFLNAIEWKVYVDSSGFWDKFGELERTVAAREGKKRGWFSYTDLELLVDYLNYLALAQSVVTVSAVCLASYMAGMLAVIGSTIVATQAAAACTNLYRPSPSTVSPVLHSESKPTVQCFRTFSNNGTTPEDCQLTDPLDAYNFLDEDPTADAQENSSYPDTILDGIRSYGRSPFGITSPQAHLNNYMAPLVKQLNVLYHRAMIPNR